MPGLRTPVLGVQFAKRGRRPKFGYGLHFASACGRYEIYKIDIDPKPEPLVRDLAARMAYARELAHDIAMSRGDRYCQLRSLNEALARDGWPTLAGGSEAVFSPQVWAADGDAWRLRFP